MRVAFIRQIAGACLIGTMATVFAISFASIIYSGPLSVSLNRGIGLALIGSGVMAGLGAFLFSFRGTIVHLQDVTAILIASAAAAIAVSGSQLSNDGLFATVLALIAVATILSGLVCVLWGRLRLAFMARYIPYPVLGGFLAATGYLLALGGIGVTIDASLSVWDLSPLLAEDAPFTWVPWTLAGIALAAISKRSVSQLLLPVFFLGGALVFYVLLAVFGTNIDDALQRGWLLGPFPEGGFLTALDPGLIGEVDWSLVASEAPTIIAIVAMTVLGGLLNITGINHIISHEGDVNADLRATGYCNIAAGGVGGLVGYPTLGETVLGSRMGLWGPLAGISVAALNFSAAWFGAALLELLPRGLFGMLLVYLGADLLWTWLATERRRLEARDFGIVLCILLTAATVGFLEALALGLLVSMTLFIISYAQFDFIRLQTTLKNRRSIAERSDPARSHLNEAGAGVVILELAGVLFFGSAARLRDRIEASIGAPGEGPETVILDFRRVRDLDVSAAIGLQQTFAALAGRGLQICLSGLNQTAKARLDRLGPLPVTRFETLDAALLAIENEILRHAAPGGESDRTFLGRLQASHPDLDLAETLPVVSTPAGEMLLVEGRPSDEIYVVIEGEASAIVGAPGDEIVVARFLSGALIGEMSFYTGEPRSASVRAESDLKTLRLDAGNLGTDGPLPQEVVLTIHRLAAATLSQRLIRMNRLLHDAEI